MRFGKLLAVVGVLALATSTMGQNTSQRITDGDAAWDVGTAAALGTSNTAGAPGGNYTTAGFAGTHVAGSDNAFSGFWSYRFTGGVAADTRERMFVSAASKTSTGANNVTYGYNNLATAGAGQGTAVAGVTALLTYAISDTGADSSNVHQRMHITNGSAGVVTMNLFSYYDLDLGGNAPSFGGDVVDPSVGNAGAFSGKTLNVRDTTSSTTPSWFMQYRGFGARNSGAGAFSAVNGQFSDTTIDDFATDLNGAGLAAGDYAEVMAWTLTLNPGESYTADLGICIVRNVNAAANVQGATFCEATPEPGTLSLLGLAAMALIRRRR